VAAACAVFAEKGFHEAKISDITDRAGVAKGTFYLYFKSKEQLFGALLDDFTYDVLVAFFIPGAEAVESGGEIRERFERITSNALTMLRRNKDLARIFLLEGGAWEPEFEGKARAFYENLAAATAKNLQAWMDKGLLRRSDPLVIAHCVIGMIERITMQWVAGTVKGDFDAMVAEVVKFELYGILKDPRAAFGEV